MRLVTTSLLLLLSFILVGQRSYYLDQTNGADSNNGRAPNRAFRSVARAIDGSNTSLQPGDTLFIMGEYHNESYRENYVFPGSTTPDDASDDDITDDHIWHQENSIRINNLRGESGRYITLKNYDAQTVIRGDGANIIRITNCSYLRIEGLTIEGRVDEIDLNTALALQFLYLNPATNPDPENLQDGDVLYRVPYGTPPAQVAAMEFTAYDQLTRPSYTDTRGLYLSNIHHVDIIGNTIRKIPGNGLRVSDAEYVNIINNEVTECSVRSYSGTHGLVVTKALSRLADDYDDTDDDTYRIRILRNTVHHNYNTIYSWAPTKTKIKPEIDEGKGISLQRNTHQDWTRGRILVANNLAFWNGFSGVHSNTGARIDFINNTCYLNSYTNTVTNAGTTNSGGGNIGISAQRSEDVKIINNISVIDGAQERFAISSDPTTTGLVVRNNIIYPTSNLDNFREDEEVVSVDINTEIADPKFTDPENFDFSLQEDSPAIGYARRQDAPDEDYFNLERDNDPDAGAIEGQTTLPVSWLSFTLTEAPKQEVNLVWQTNEEFDNAFFAPEHSTDGNRWTVLGQIPANGTQTTISEYHYLHAAGGGRHFYRIRQVDLDGSSSYSPIRSINLRQTAEGTGLIAYPNPAGEVIRLRWSYCPRNLKTIALHDLLGRRLLDFTLTERDIRNGSISLPLDKLRAGVYLLRVGEEVIRIRKN